MPRCPFGRATTNQAAGHGCQPTESLKELQSALTKPPPADRHKESSVEDMPPLHAAAGRAPATEESSEEEDMPPLHDAAGHPPATGSKGAAQAQEPGGQHEESSEEEDMPPLHAAAGHPPATGSKGAAQAQEPGGQHEESSEEENMPPLQAAAGHPPAACREEATRTLQPGSQHEESSEEEDMPALDAKVGEESGFALKEGAEGGFEVHPAEKQCLQSREEENSTYAACSDGRLVPSSCEEPLAKEDKSEETDSGDSLPPLEFISPTERRLHSDAEDTGHASLGPGDLVQLVDLRAQGLNGQEGYVIRLSSGDQQRVEVRMLVSGKTLAVRRRNVRPREAEEVRSQSQESLRKGDEIVVRGLTSALEYNGQKGLVVESDAQRITVELRSGRRLSLRRDKLQRVPQSESEDDRPPSRQAKSKKEPPATAAKFQVGQKVYLNIPKKPEYHGQMVFVLPSDPLRVLDSTMVTVQLPTGRRIVTKETHLQAEAPGSTSCRRSSKRKP